MINVFKVKKWAALILVGVITTIAFAIVSVYFGILYGALGFLIGLLLSVVIGNLMLKNPFTAMLEGQGLLALDINSSGIIKPFIVKFNAPYIQGKVGGQNMQDIFNRDTIGQLSNPIEAGTAEWKNGKLHIELDNEQYTNSRMVLFHYPVIIWNSIINSLMTKEQLSEIEKDTFSEHIILYLNRKLDELTSLVRDFGRYIVELTKPKSMMSGRTWVWIIIIVLFIILAALFAPSIIEQITNTGATAVDSISGNPIINPQ